MNWDVKCNVDKIVVDVKTFSGELHTPVMNYPDMSRTISMFKSIDPEINQIYVYVDSVPDVVYLRNSKNNWEALRV